MVSIKRLTLRAFRSFQDEATIELPACGFVLVDGQDLDTGGSSGSGKTSLVEAIAFALGYSTLPATELHNRNTNLSLQVKLLLSTDHGDVELARGEKNYIKYLEGNRTITGAKLIAEELVKLIGLPTELVEALTYRPQRSLGRFVSMTDSEKKEFLTNCLPELIEIENVAEASRVACNELENKLNQSVSHAIQLEAELERHRHNDPAQQLKPVDTTSIQLQIDSTQQQLQIASEDILKTIEAKRTLEHTVAATLESLNQQKRQTETSIMSLRVENAAKLKEVDELITNRRNVLQTFVKTYAQKGSVEEKIVKREKEIKSLEASVCPTCNRQWDSAVSKIESIIQEVEILRQKLLVIQEAGRRIAPMEQEIADLEKTKTSISTDEIEKLTAELGNIKTQILAADLGIKDLDRELRSKENDIGGLKRQASLLTDQLRSARQKNAEIAAQIERHRKTIRHVEDLIKTERESAEPIRLNLALERSVYRALGRTGYLGAIFDEILAEISNEVTEVLALVPNVSSVALKFCSEHETKKGTTKRSIVPLITKDGHQAPLNTLSGGQQASVELAVDLAIGNVIARRTGRTPGWIVLDEAFDGMDVPTKESCMTILKRYASNRLVLVIDHTSEIKETFDQHIRVVMQSGVSTLQL